MRFAPPSINGRVDVPGWVGVGVLALFTIAAVVGYWVFALHPNLIPDTSFAREFYGLSFKLFARAHIIVAGVVLAVYLSRRAGLRWLPAFAAVALASFASEHIGTGYGFPFGGYEYTGLLGFKIGGRVPLVIPISWFLMALPSWTLARTLFPSGKERIPRFVLGAYLLTSWDLALDPAMSFLTPYWVWENPGPFFGMPWVNLAGWMGTGLVLMALIEATGARQWTPNLSTRWILAYYATVLLMPVGMLAAAGLWIPIGVTALALGVGWMAAMVLKSGLLSAKKMALAEEAIR
jgi:putative membrane protein